MSIVLRSAPNQQGYYTIPDLPVFRLRGTKKITASVNYIFYAKLYEVFVGSYNLSLDKDVEIDFKEILIPLLSTQEVYPPYSNVLHQNFVKEIRITFQDEDGSIERTFFLLNVNAKVQQNTLDTLTSRFLTCQPDVKETTTHSPEYLTYLYRGIKRLMVRFYYISGENREMVLFSSESESLRAISLDVSYNKVIPLLKDDFDIKPFYDVYVVDADHNIVSVTQRYVIRPSNDKDKYYIYKNALGGVDTIITNGHISYSPEISFDIARKNKELIQLENPDDHIKYSQKTFFSAEYIPCIIDFIKSKNRYIYYPEIKKVKKITITETDVDFNQYESIGILSFSYRMDDAPEINTIDKQSLIVENIQFQTMPTADDIDSAEELYTTELIECTMDSVNLKIGTKGNLSVYTFDDGIWNIIRKTSISGEIELTLHDLKIGSYIKLESNKPIDYAEWLFFTQYDINAKIIWDNNDIWDNKTIWY